MKIYVASSWRNEDQPRVVNVLKEHGHDVYDFRNPGGEPGFSWDSVDKNWECWDVAEFKKALNHPVAKAGYRRDMRALAEADVCLLVLPCGRSAHLEAGYAAWTKTQVLFIPPLVVGVPELMYNMCDEILYDWPALSARAKQLKSEEAASLGSI